jgi:pimeloyl-ACP methyl ester carboxylesterase
MYVFIFGFGNDTRYTQWFLQHFKNSNHRVIYYKPSICLSDIENIIFSLPTQKINLVGFSLGAIFALQFSNKHPTWINRVLLLGFPTYSHLFFTKKQIKKKLIDTFIYLFRICPWSFNRIKRCVYIWMNNDSPHMVVDTVSSYNWTHALADLKYLLTIDAGKMILQSEQPIHFLYGKNDEFKYYGNILTSCYNHAYLHVCEGNHHFILNESSIVANKIKYICKDKYVYCDS